MKFSVDQLFEGFSRTTALVIGDVMIDAYLWGTVDRISPEAPVPVVNVNRKEERLGGAANVALNLAALGARPLICSVVGKDSAADRMVQLMKNEGMSADGLLLSESRATTVKTRVISHAQQMLRVDEEQTNALSPEDEKKFIAIIGKVIQSEKPGVIIFEDYNKGVLTPVVISSILALAEKEGIPTCVDPKKLNFFSYKKVTLFKPNLKELKEGLKLDFDKSNDSALLAAVEQLEKELNNSISLITLSERGVFIKDESGARRFPAHVRNIADVSGAGDTVIAVAALCLAQNVDARVLARIANLAGGLVCEKVGVVPVDKDQLFEEAQKEFFREQ